MTRPVSPLEWAWRAWYLGEGAYKGHRRDPALRPAVPTNIIRDRPLWFPALAAFVARRKLTRPPVAPATPVEVGAGVAPVWRRGVVFVNNLSSFDAAHQAAAEAAGYRTLAVLLDPVVDPGAGDNQREMVVKQPELQARDWTFTGWAACYSDPEAGAARARALVERFHLAGWISNWELWGEAQHAALPTRFVNEWGRLGVAAPLALSCLSSTTPNFARSFDYAPWVDVGAAIMPQVYGNVDAGYTVYNMVETMRRGGVPLGLLVPTFGVYGPVNPYDDYRTWRASWRGAQGVYVGERLPPTDWAWLSVGTV